MCKKSEQVHPFKSQLMPTLRRSSWFQDLHRKSQLFSKTMFFIKHSKLQNRHRCNYSLISSIELPKDFFAQSVIGKLKTKVFLSGVSYTSTSRQA